MTKTVVFSLINCGASKGGVFQYALTFIEDFISYSISDYKYIALIDDQLYSKFLPSSVEIVEIEHIPANKRRISRIINILSNYGVIPKNFGRLNYHKLLIDISPDYLIALNQRPDLFYTSHKGISVIHDAPRCWNKYVRKIHPIGYTLQFDSECRRILSTRKSITLVESNQVSKMLKSSSYNIQSFIIPLKFRVFHPNFANPDLEFCNKVKSIDAYVYYPSTTHPVKNHKRLIDAIKIFNDFSSNPLSLILSGPKDTFTQEIVDYAKDKIDLFHFGYVKENEKYFLYKSSRGLVMPSLFNFGNIPILEAYHWGIPFLASNYNSIIESTCDQGEYVNPKSIDSIASGLYRLYRKKGNNEIASDPLERKNEFQNIFTLLEKL